MENAEKLKQLVREKYSQIAGQSKENNMSSCCGAGGCSTEVYNIMSEDYTTQQGYNPDADLGLGCGTPTGFARMKPGDVIVDLGSGAGNDCFVARSFTGESGKVIGIDMTETMIEKARANAEKLGFNNLEFRLGEIEKLPLTANKADVVLSNCVLNLVPDKHKAFQEIFRILKPNAHFCISDVVLKGILPDSLREASEMYAGCVAGAIQKEDYLQIIREAGFRKLQVHTEKPIHIPDDILAAYMTPSELESYRSGEAGIFSITVSAEKPSETSCCPPGCCES